MRCGETGTEERDLSFTYCLSHSLTMMCEGTEDNR